jgi:hypothetical protein
MRLTAVRIIHHVIRFVDGASINLALGCDVRRAGRDLIPECQALSVAREEGQLQAAISLRSLQCSGERARKYM